MKLISKMMPLLAVLVFVGLAAFWSQGLASYTNSEFSTRAGNDLQVSPGDDGVFLGRITLPTPDTDTQIINGATAVIAAGDSLSAFASTNRFMDVDLDAIFDSGEGVISSADAVLDESDTVVTSPASVSYGTFGGSESSQTMYGFIDADADSTLDLGEDVVRQIRSGTAETLTSGDQIKVLPAAEVYFVAQAGTSSYSYSWPGGIIDLQASNSNWTLIQSGKINYLNFTASDNVCLNDKDSNGTYSGGDVIWRDLNGTDCQTFNSGTDVIINAQGVGVTTPNIEITGSEVGVSFGFMDADGDGAYDCSRVLCEALVLALADYADGATMSSANTYVMGCPATNPDDIAVSGTCWTEDPVTLMNAYDMSAQSASTGEERFMFVDTNGDSNIQGDQEDILMVVAAGADDVLSNGDVFRTLGANDKYIDYNVNSSFEATEGDILIRSADSDLDIGALDGSGTDHVLSNSTINNLAAFPANTKYHDHNSSGTYAEGDDIIRDVDLSTYYNADDLTAAAIQAAGSYAVTDSDLDGLYVYGRSDTSCSGGGSTLLGSDTSAPMLNTLITLTRAPHTTAETLVLCLYADIKSSATPGRVFNPRFGTTDLTFASGGAPTDSAVTLATDATAVNVVSSSLSATLSASSLIKQRSTTYTANFTSGATLASGGGVSVTFPVGYSVASATITCTEDGGATTGSSGVDGQVVTYTLSGDSIASGAAVSCAISGVTNPSTTGATGTFSVTSYASISSGITAEIDASDTVTIESSSGGGGSYIPVKTEAIDIIKPTNLADWSVSGWYFVEWANTGTHLSPYVNIFITDSAGTRTTLAHNVPNTGLKSVYVSNLTAGPATVVVEGTDLMVVGASDSVTVALGEAVAEPNEPVSTVEYCEVDGATRLNDYRRPSLSDGLVKTPTSSTVFYQTENGILRPFFTEPHFFAWGLLFSDVRTVGAETLSNLKFGAPMPPAPGTSLVKSPLGPEVYVLEPNLSEPSEPTLHWLATEEVAGAYFGADWALRVTDVSPAIIQGATKGADTDLDCRPWYVDIE